MLIFQYIQKEQLPAANNSGNALASTWKNPLAIRFEDLSPEGKQLLNEYRNQASVELEITKDIPSATKKESHPYTIDKTQEMVLGRGNYNLPWFNVLRYVVETELWNTHKGKFIYNSSPDKDVQSFDNADGYLMTCPQSKPMEVSVAPRAFIKNVFKDEAKAIYSDEILGEAKNIANAIYEYLISHGRSPDALKMAAIMVYLRVPEESFNNPENQKLVLHLPKLVEKYLKDMGIERARIACSTVRLNFSTLSERVNFANCNEVAEKLLSSFLRAKSTR